MANPIETAIFGGQAGLSMSYHLAQPELEHVILERGRIAERWRSERWDSLTFQLPNWMVKLPGYAYVGTAPDGFMSRNEVVRFIEEYAKRIAPPRHPFALRHSGDCATPGGVGRASHPSQRL